MKYLKNGIEIEFFFQSSSIPQVIISDHSQKTMATPRAAGTPAGTAGTPPGVATGQSDSTRVQKSSGINTGVNVYARPTQTASQRIATGGEGDSSPQG